LAGEHQHVLGPLDALESSGGNAEPWVCPPWLRPYLGLVTGLRGETVEALLNDRTADAESDPARARRIDLARAQVRLLEALHVRGILLPLRGL
jgi:hypothetical protein